VEWDGVVGEESWDIDGLDYNPARERNSSTAQDSNSLSEKLYSNM